MKSSAYWEIPIGADNAFVAAPWVEQNYDTPEGWRGEATLGLKHVLARGPSSIVSVQASALWMSHPETECGEGGVEARLLAGKGFGQGGFVNVEAGLRGLEGGCGGERVDLTAGVRPAENWLALGQVFLDRPPYGEESIDVQVSLVRFSQDDSAVQVGVRARADGGAEEFALVLSFWGRPGD